MNMPSIATNNTAIKNEDVDPRISTKEIQKRLVLAHGQTYLPSPNCSTIMNVPLTKSHFIDAYSKGKWNLSKIPCPSFFKGLDLMPPPDHYNEASRLKAVKKFMFNEQWKNRLTFNKLIAKALKAFSVNGAAISLVDSKRQVVKYQVSLNINECPKRVSIDAHAVLSIGNFVLSDASKDWRTANNPFVKGDPHIRFYAGVPLITKFGAVIGIFSIFDSFPKQEFTIKQLSILQGLSDEVMNILGTPLQDSEPSSMNTMSLIKTIGRPTRQGNQFSPTAVYEKDGSGTSYSRNLNFRYGLQNLDPIDSGNRLNEKIAKQLATKRDIKTASFQLSKIIANSLNIDLCAVVEIRVCQRYQIPSEFFPQENSIEAESFRFPNELVKIDDESIMSRLLGSYGYDNKDLEFSSDMYYSSLSSEFGVFYESTYQSNVMFRSGIVMPFYRVGSKLMRKRKIIRSGKYSRNEKPIEVYLRSGGFLIACFNEKDRAISDEEINAIYGAACILRRIFISN